MIRKNAFSGLMLGALVAACGSPGHPENVTATPTAHLSQAALAPETNGDSVASATAAMPGAKVEAKDAALDWVVARLPTGGHASRDEKGAIAITHEVQPKDTAASIAKEYLAVSEVYLAPDLAKGIQKQNPKTGATITIPEPVQEAYPAQTEARMPWPTDKKLRGIYLGGRDALGSWEDTLDRMKARGMNLIILDAKEYMGQMTYPSKVDVAVKTGGTRGALIQDMGRAIRFAHKRGVVVSLRIACFHDPWSAEKAPELSIKGNWGGPYPIGWLDPGGENSQKYIFDLVQEALDLGADEINLDYVRYPVQGGLGNADFHLKDTGRTTVSVITKFVHDVHAITQKAHVPLSVDVFGVTAIGSQADVDGLGQDIGHLAPECEALMPMVYPSHYGKGFYGWDIPGNHPEIVGIGTKAAVAKLPPGDHVAVIRPWVQASSWNTPNYSPQYLKEETVSGEAAGGAGYTMWNPGGFYGDAWRGIDPIKK
ncbi:hypothetical protein BH09MYX1_BH09MYX1_24490 [soil metagenome]